MRIACWSGPRNISTALMRSWSSRKNSYVTDEPLYSYYLKKTGLTHPMYQEIINRYPSEFKNVIKYISGPIPRNKKIWYQKHMAHHILDLNNIEFILSLQNTFLIRDPKYVISSYRKKNKLSNHKELGYYQQIKMIKFLELNSKDYTIIDSSRLLENPKKVLKKWCQKINIDFDEDMLKWKKGYYSTDGIWGKHWYDNVINSTTFDNKNKYKHIILRSDEIYERCRTYYEKMLDRAI